jgi:hypothetical protein
MIIRNHAKRAKYDVINGKKHSYYAHAQQVVARQYSRIYRQGRLIILLKLIIVATINNIMLLFSSPMKILLYFLVILGVFGARIMAVKYLAANFGEFF